LSQSAWKTITTYKQADYWGLNLNYNDALNNNVITTQFQIKGNEWRISWSCGSSIIVSSHFRIVVYDDATGQIVKEVTSTADDTSNGGSQFWDSGQYQYADFYKLRIE
jgi:hypothetical protein